MRTDDNCLSEIPLRKVLNTYQSRRGYQLRTTFQLGGIQWSPTVV